MCVYLSFSLTKYCKLNSLLERPIKNDNHSEVWGYTYSDKKDKKSRGHTFVRIYIFTIKKTLSRTTRQISQTSVTNEKKTKTQQRRLI